MAKATTMIEDIQDSVLSSIEASGQLTATAISSWRSGLGTMLPQWELPEVADNVRKWTTDAMGFGMEVVKAQQAAFGAILEAWAPSEN